MTVRVTVPVTRARRAADGQIVTVTVARLDDDDPSPGDSDGCTRLRVTFKLPVLRPGGGTAALPDSESVNTGSFKLTVGLRP